MSSRVDFITTPDTRSGEWYRPGLQPERQGFAPDGGYQASGFSFLQYSARTNLMLAAPSLILQQLDHEEG